MQLTGGGLRGTGSPAAAAGAIGAADTSAARRRRCQSAFLHLTRAELLSRDIEFDLELTFGTVVIVLPRKAEISTDGLYAKGVGRRPNVRIDSGIQGSHDDPATDLRIRLAGRMDIFSNVRLRWPSRGELRRLRRATSRAYS